MGAVSRTREGIHLALLTVWEENQEASTVYLAGTCEQRVRGQTQPMTTNE